MELFQAFYQNYFFESIAATAAIAAAFGYFGAPIWMWALLGEATLYGAGASQTTQVGWCAVGALLTLRPIRRYVLSLPVLKAMQGFGLVPKISDTEKAALDAGAVWVEADCFSGKPNFKKMMNEAYPKLTAEEQAYIDGPIEELCKMVNDWKIYQNKEIPKEIWSYMRKIRIFGMIVPKKYGGLEFSALAHSEVIMKLASRSIPVTITAMVPNSLGPAELLNHFGTEEQKNHYLPKLATGEFLPCFALTEQRAGSDAGSLESNGELFKKNGELWIRLNWNKRWITLAGVSNVIGLAFELRDPEKLVGQDLIIGITCALIPSTTPGVVLGRRHDPLGVPFYNCPTQGQNVEVPASFIIGGMANAGKGWTMLMESLGAGRGVSLPSQAVGGSKVVARVTSAHTSIRRQFGIPLCKLEGLEEPLARIGANTYMLDAMRRYTVGALDKGIKPSVVTAIAKFAGTEMGRRVVNDGMDIMAGAGISRGPRNVIANIYQATPIGITVEGANILTRTMIIFGQGLFRAHPWAYKEVSAIEKGDLKAFDYAFFSHIGHVVNNVFRAVVLSVTRGYFVMTPFNGSLRRYAQKFHWASATFAVLADIAMGTLGGELKKKEKLTGRFADVLSCFYMSVAVMRRFEAEGRKKEDLPFVQFALTQCLNEVQQALDGIFANIRVPGASFVFNKLIRTWFRFNAIAAPVTDKQGHKAAVALLKEGGARDRLCEGIFYPKDENEALGRLEKAFHTVTRAEEVERRILHAVGNRLLPKKRIFKLVELAHEKGINNTAEMDLLNESAMARWKACQVDDFSEEAYHGVEGSDNKQFRGEYVGPAGAPQYYKPKKTA
ncbi:MAG: acyl-CoA dehydrogenase [Bacteriovoracia bacterium]